MSKKQNKKYRYRKRIFLNEDYESSAYLIAIVENSKYRNASLNGDDSDGGVKLLVESPYDKVSLNFELDLPDQVKESLSKIREFESLLKQFRKAVEKEAKARKKLSYEHIKDEIISVR
ncbi:hypothetical protein BH18ACI1_BH18ACI1_21330 [soil metagenome]|jgi:hypothetical protein